jgi:hypothetical protein
MTLEVDYDTNTRRLGLISYCTPYFLNADNLNWGAKYGYIWAGSNAIAFGETPTCPLCRVYADTPPSLLLPSHPGDERAHPRGD